MDTTIDLKSSATAYIEAVGNKNFAAVEALLASDVAFKGPFMQLNSAAEFVGALRRLASILERNDVRYVFADDERACIVYDFVTSTESGSIPTIEVLTFRDGKIAGVELFFDRMQFAAARDEIAKRAAK